MSRKALFTLCVDGYSPEITAMTFPLMRYYARKIGAEFHVIDQRKFPEWPVTVEKFQIYDLAKSIGAEWNIFFDADALIHPETIDFTAFIPKDTVAHNGSDPASIRWRLNEYFLRDGRNIGSCNWCAIASEWCLDFWTPPTGESPDKVVANIFPTVEELNTVITPEHLVDDYLMSRNIARYGLKFTTLMDVQKKVTPNANFFWHAYTIPAAEKVEQMKAVLDTWKVPDAIRQGV